MSDKIVIAKNSAKKIKARLASLNINISLAHALEAVAAIENQPDWNRFVAACKEKEDITPVEANSFSLNLPTVTTSNLKGDENNCILFGRPLLGKTMAILNIINHHIKNTQGRILIIDPLGDKLFPEYLMPLELSDPAQTLLLWDDDLDDINISNDCRIIYFRATNIRPGRKLTKSIVPAFLSLKDKLPKEFLPNLSLLIIENSLIFTSDGNDDLYHLIDSIKSENNKTNIIIESQSCWDTKRIPSLKGFVNITINEESGANERDLNSMKERQIPYIFINSKSTNNVNAKNDSFISLVVRKMNDTYKKLTTTSQKDLLKKPKG